MLFIHCGRTVFVLRGSSWELAAGHWILDLKSGFNITSPGLSVVFIIWVKIMQV